MSNGKSLKARAAFPKVVVILIEPSVDMAVRCFASLLMELGSLCDPGPGPSTLAGRKWSLFLTLELNRVPNEKTGVVLPYFAL